MINTNHFTRDFGRDGIINRSKISSRNSLNPLSNFVHVAVFSRFTYFGFKVVFAKHFQRFDK